MTVANTPVGGSEKEHGQTPLRDQVANECRANVLPDEVSPYLAICQADYMRSSCFLPHSPA